MNQGDLRSYVPLAVVVIGGALLSIALFSLYGDLTNPPPPAVVAAPEAAKALLDAVPETLVANEPPAAVPAAAPPPAKINPETEIKAELLAFVSSWRSAWSNNDVNRYLEFYDKSFQGTADTPEQWRASRRRIIGQAGKIEISIDEPDIQLDGTNGAIISFPMTYRTSRLNDRGIKQLQLSRTNDRWMIVQEQFTPN